MNVQPFSAAPGATLAILPTSVSQSVTFTTPAINLNSIRVYNGNTVPVALRTGLAGRDNLTALVPVVGTPGDVVVPPGIVEVYSKGYPIDTVSIIAIGTAGAGNVYPLVLQDH
jgi:hypothetical protein